MVRSNFKRGKTQTQSNQLPTPVTARTYPAFPAVCYDDYALQSG